MKEGLRKFPVEGLISAIILEYLVVAFSKME